MKGRKKIPTNLKILRGTDRADRRNNKEPQPELKAPECPRDIDLKAKRAWERFAPKLEDLGVLTEIDEDMFAILMQIRTRLKTLYAMQRKNAREIKKALRESDTDILPFLHRERSWIFKEERLYSQQFRCYAVEFGISPSSRAKINIVEKPKNPENPYEKWKKQQKKK